jgi:tyrosyl-tRNA synthetase
MLQNVLEILKKRSFIDQVSSEVLKERLNKPINFYIGFDPTADSLHLGNLVPIIAMSWFRRCGHTAYAVCGGATGRIGDPSGKSIERPLRDDAVIEKDVKSIEKQLRTILTRQSEGPEPKFINNDDWLKNLSVIAFLRDIGKNFRLGPMLGKESVRLRLSSEEGMSFTEFSYQILQAYDFYHLNKSNEIELQIGGSDQWGNITAGIELIRRLNNKTAYAITLPLLTRSDGKKFGKSESGAIWLSPDKLSPYEFYQYLVKVADSDVIKLLKVLTFLSIEEIEEIDKSMKSSTYKQNTAQKILAKEVTKFVHGDEGLEIALKVTKGARPGSEACLDKNTLEQISKDMPHIKLSIEEVIEKKYTEIAVISGLVKSKSEAVRLIKNQGAYLNNHKIEDVNFMIKKENLIEDTYLLLGMGKKKKILISLL